MTKKTETGTEGDAEKSGADDLDALLSEFDEGSSETKPEQQTDKVTAAELAEMARTWKQDREEQQTERVRKDIASMVQTIKGDLEADDDLVEGWADRRAAKDPRLQKAWQERHNNPASYQRVVERLKTEFQDKYGEKFAKPESDTRESVEAAVRSASTKAPDAKPLTKDDWRKMTPQQRREEQAKFGVR